MSRITLNSNKEDFDRKIGIRESSRYLFDDEILRPDPSVGDDGCLDPRTVRKYIKKEMRMKDPRHECLVLTPTSFQVFALMPTPCKAMAMALAYLSHSRERQVTDRKGIVRSLHGTFLKLDRDVREQLSLAGLDVSRPSQKSAKFMPLVREYDLLRKCSGHRGDLYMFNPMFFRHRNIEYGRRLAEAIDFYFFDLYGPPD